MADGSVSTTFSYTAVSGDTAQDVANALSTLITADADFNSTVTSVAGQIGINITDANANNGGFSIATEAFGGFSGSGASVYGAVGATLADAGADLITDFVPGVDHVVFDGMDAGTAANYAEGGEVANYAAALLAATGAMNGVVQYYLTSVPDNDVTAALNDATGLLFFDANGDSIVDGVVALTGISSANFAYTDIAAA